MAETVEKRINVKPIGENQLVALPVASGEIIYGGTFAILSQGYLYNLDSDNIPSAGIVVIVSDETDNKTGPAATTANGSITDPLDRKSVV